MFQQDFRVNGPFSQIAAKISALEKSVAELLARRVATASILWIPFGVYANTSPLSASPSYPYLHSIDRTITFVSWFQHVYVAAPNTGAAYWNIKLITTVAGVYGTEIAALDTSAVSAATHTLLDTTTFSVASVDTSNIGVWVECTKTGAPGNLYIGGPTVCVTA